MCTGMIKTIAAAAGISLLITGAAVNLSRSIPDPPQEYRPRIQKESLRAKEEADMIFLSEHRKEVPEEVQKYLYAGGER